MESFTPLNSLAGGLVIGLASALLLLLNGRIAGVSGIAGGLLRFQRHHMLWRALFVAGLMAGGLVWGSWAPQAFLFKLERSTWALLGAGLLVGFGTQLGDGCTSGHGICGLSRLSPRSLVAVLTFMGAAAITVFVVGHFFGGRL